MIVERSFDVLDAWIVNRGKRDDRTFGFVMKGRSRAVL